VLLRLARASAITGAGGVLRGPAGGASLTREADLQDPIHTAPVTGAAEPSAVQPVTGAAEPSAVQPVTGAAAPPHGPRRKRCRLCFSDAYVRVVLRQALEERGWQVGEEVRVRVSGGLGLGLGSGL
jgi:hypothetical protein